MRELILAAQSALRAGLDPAVYRTGSNPEQSDIFIADNEQYLPKTRKLPAIGIKDSGESELTEYACGEGLMVEEGTFSVVFICWAPSLGNTVGGGIIGTVTSPGVQNIKRDLHHVLRNNLLGLDWVRMVKRGPVPASQTSIPDGARTAQSLNVTYTYDIKRKYTGEPVYE